MARLSSCSIRTGPRLDEIGGSPGRVARLHDYNYNSYGVQGILRLPAQEKSTPMDMINPRPTDFSKAEIVALVNMDGEAVDPDLPLIRTTAATIRCRAITWLQSTRRR